MTDWILHRLGSTPAVLAIDLETAVFLVVVVVSLLGRLFGRKEDPDHGQEWFDEERDDYNQQQQQAAAMDWEEQMRRLLEGEPAEPKPQPQPQSKSVVPPPVPQQEGPPPIPVAQPISAPLQSSTTTARLVSVDDLKSSHAALEEAKKKAAAAYAQLEGVTKRRARRKVRAGNAIEMLQHPSSAQQAIIASVILGKPKGLN